MINATNLTNIKRIHFKRWASLGIVLMILASLASPCAAGTILSTLGSAGPGNWAILAGPNVADFALNGPGTTNGTVGDGGSNTLQLNASSGHQAINGNLYLASGDSVSNAAQVTGSIFSNMNTILTAAWSDALTASAAFQGMTANQTINGNVNSNTTINATGTGTYVVNVNGNLSSNLMIVGNAFDNVIINITGKLQFNSNSVTLSGGLTSSDVVLNFVGNGGDLQTSGGLNNESVINAILLAPSRNIGFAPGLVNGEIIAGGRQLHLVSGASATQVTPEAVPEPATFLLAGSALLALGSLARRRTTAPGNAT